MADLRSAFVAVVVVAFVNGPGLAAAPRHGALLCGTASAMGASGPATKLLD